MPNKDNFTWVPSAWFDKMTKLSVNGIQVVLYALRHTQEFNNKGLRNTISFYEFVNGVVQLDGTRIDSGCGLSKRSAQTGIQEAKKNGFIEELEDDGSWESCWDTLYKIYTISNESESER